MSQFAQEKTFYSQFRGETLLPDRRGRRLSKADSPAGPCKASGLYKYNLKSGFVPKSKLKFGILLLYNGNKTLRLKLIFLIQY